MNSISLQVQRDGWPALCESISSTNLLFRLYTIMHLLEIMRDNTEETLIRLGLIDRGEVSKLIILGTLKKWLSGVFIKQLFAFSYKLETRIFCFMHGHPDKEIEIDRNVSAKPLFGQFTLIDSRIEIRPLLTYLDLQEEGEEMRNCVASSYTAVITYRALITSLLCLLTGERATLSMFRSKNGIWKIRELKGPRNQAIAKDSLLDNSANELIDLLINYDKIFNREIISLYENLTPESDLTFQRHFENGRPIFHLLPIKLAASFEKHIPGNGSLDSRVLWAFETTTKLRKKNIVTQGDPNIQRSAG